MYGSGFADPPIRVPTPIEVGHKPSPIVGTMVNLKMTIVPTMHSRSHTLTCMEVALQTPMRSCEVPTWARRSCQSIRTATGQLYRNRYRIVVSSTVFDLSMLGILQGARKDDLTMLGILHGARKEYNIDEF